MAHPPSRSRPTEPIHPRRNYKAVSLEDQIRFCYYTPGPSVYSPYNPNIPDITEPKPLGKFGTAKATPVTDYVANIKAFVPGPGAYETPDLGPFPLPEGGRLNRKPPPEKFSYDNSPRPGPGAYAGANCVVPDPARPRNVFGKFGRDQRVTKFIQEEENRSRGIPGPGAHDVMEAMEASKPFCPEGGRYLNANKPPGYFEMAPKLTEDVPAPGTYDLPSSLNTKTVGRLVYRYESATIQETRVLLTRVIGNADDAPGPGAYTLPDPPPLNGVPTLKGRQLPFAMPHPFAYNCAPDTAQKFSLLAPVRQHNNADQIFGTGVRRGGGNAPSKARPSSAGADEVSARDLKALPQVPAVPNENDVDVDAVQWKSGGFTSLKKSRSTGNVKVEHPSIEEAAKFYPMLARKHRSGVGPPIFQPMASRRSEVIPTGDTSEEYQKLRRSKWQLNACVQGLAQATSLALEPLDVERLKGEAMSGLKDKALYRMKLQGVPKEHYNLVLSEMERILDSRSHARASEETFDEEEDDGTGDIFQDLIGGRQAGLAEPAGGRS